VVKKLALALPGVDAAVRYDGSPVLRVRGVFMAGMATHPSAEVGSLVARIDPEDRRWLLEDAPETYYVTDSYQRHPVVLVRLSRIDREALRGLLALAWRASMAKAQGRISPRRGIPAAVSRKRC
jgi:hypothetical protein